MGSGQADSARTRTKSGFALRAKSAWPEKEAKVYQNPRPVAVTTSLLVCISIGLLTAFVDVILVHAPWAAKGGIRPVGQEHLPEGLT